MGHAHLFQHNNFAGRQLIADNPGNDRYALTPFITLFAFSFNDITSSLQLHPGTSDPCMCILFQNSRFNGNFNAFAYNTDRNVNSLPGFNDVTSSVLLVKHDPRRKSILQLKTLAGARINDAIDENLKGISEASRNGDVKLKFVIDLSEASLFGTDLVLIEVPVKIHTPWPFSDYNAKIRYWINLFIDGSNRLQGFVNAWGYWIEGGILTGSIESELRPQVEANIGTIESQLNMMLLEVSFHKWTDVYVMPGALSGDSSDYSGNVDDEVSVVLPYLE